MTARTNKPNEAHTFFVDGLEIRVTYKRVKNVSLKVKPPDGHIEISAPHNYPFTSIERFVRQKRTWIESAQKRVLNSPSSIAENASTNDLAAWKEIVSACVPPLVEAWEPILGVHAQSLVYRNMKSRWGSCQPATGRICINTRLALYPPECLEYVVVHELCHLLVSGHGPEFHALMTRVMPDWKARRARLR
jgi:predicted metal-dependent hydrolase